MQQSPSWGATRSSASPVGSLLCSQEPINCPCLEPDQSSPVLASYFSNIHFNIILPYTSRSLNWFHSFRFVIKTLYAFLFSPIHATSISPSLTWKPKKYLVRSKNHAAPHYPIFSGHLLCPASHVQISSQAPYSWTPSAYVFDVRVTVHRDKFLYNKPTRCTDFSNLFWKENPHILDSSSVHHQEFFTVHTAMVYVIQVCWQLASRIRMEILMMDRGTVQNMWSFLPKINLRN